MLDTLPIKSMNSITPNMIPEKYFIRFQKLYFEKFGVKLTYEEATRGATDLINLMKVLLKPYPNN